MTIEETKKIAEAAKRLYKELNSLRDIAELLTLSLSDVIYLIFADSESKYQRFEAKKPDQIMKIIFTVFGK